MAVTLDATPGSPTANSYTTLAEANAYHDSVLFHDAWTDNADLQVNALITATRLLDENAVWSGWRTNVGQALGHPRSGMTDRDGYLIVSTAVHVAVKHATAELARLLIIANTMPNEGDKLPAGLTGLTAGPVSLQFNPTLTWNELSPIPSAVWVMINFLVESRTQGDTSVALVRR